LGQYIPKFLGEISSFVAAESVVLFAIESYLSWSNPSHCLLDSQFFVEKYPLNHNNTTQTLKQMDPKSRLRSNSFPLPDSSKVSVSNWQPVAVEDAEWFKLNARKP
jgi:hypothetical protein